MAPPLLLLGTVMVVAMKERYADHGLHYNFDVCCTAIRGGRLEGPSAQNTWSEKSARRGAAHRM
jgi:hypothetical protein